ncbi:MAG: hypothetical protein FWE83_00440 [Oscillospiraceae bacterium]|nr:hypothetical protein [Oscillospiraceae bacterium]
MDILRIKKPDIISIIKHDRFYVFLIALFVFIICAWHIPQRESIYLTTDEFSQYSIAAFFAGFDWSNVTSYIFYYQFGYPLIFILPLFWIFGDDMLMVYRASLVINALLASSMVPLVYYLLKHWGLKSFWENKVSILIAVMLTLQGCVVAYSNLGISEILLMVLGLLSTALFVKILKTGATHKIVMLLAFILAYGYAAHMRFLGVLMSGVLVLLLIVFFNKTSKKYLLSFFAVLLVSIVLSELIKQYNQASIWLYTDTGLFGSDDVNDIAATSGRLAELFTRRGFGGFIRVLFGQMWYMGFASFLLVYVGVLVILRENILSIRRLIKEKSCTGYDFTALFVFLGFIATLTISALFFMHSGTGVMTRADTIMYGRYNSIMLIPISLYAISSIIYSKLKPYVIGIFSVIIFSCLAVFLNSYIERFLSQSWFMHFNVINFIVFGSVYVSSFFAINVSLLVFMSMFTKYKQMLLSIVMAIMIIFSIHAGYRFISRDVLKYNDNITLNSFTEFKEYEEIYYFTGDPIILPRIQMALPNTRINVVSEFPELSNDDILFSCSYLLFNTIIRHGISVNASIVESGVAQIHDYSTGENPVTLPISLFSSQNGDIRGNSITSDGVLGFLVYGPKALLDPGSYTFSVQLELLNQDEAPDNIGYVELAHFMSTVIIDRRYYSLEDFEDGVLTIVLNVETDEPLPDFEIRVLSAEGMKVRVPDIALILPDSE